MVSGIRGREPRDIATALWAEGSGSGLSAWGPWEACRGTHGGPTLLRLGPPQLLMSFG